MIVQVYRNLHKNKFSIRHKGKVIGHADYLMLKDAVFRVQPAGNQKVRDTGRKNVHAYIQGELCEKHGHPNLDLEAVTYNPYKHRSFVRKSTQMPIYQAPYVWLRTDEVFAAYPNGENNA